MKAKIVLNDDKICDYLNVGFFSPNGQMEDCYCEKYSKPLPNGGCAMMYCWNLYSQDKSFCWFELNP